MSWSFFHISQFFFSLLKPATIAQVVAAAVEVGRENIGAVCFLMLCNLNFPAKFVVAVGVVVAVVAAAAVGLVELSTALVRYKLERPHNYRGHNFLPEFLDLNNYALWISEIVEKAYHSNGEILERYQLQSCGQAEKNIIEN